MTLIRTYCAAAKKKREGAGRSLQGKHFDTLCVLSSPMSNFSALPPNKVTPARRLCPSVSRPAAPPAAAAPCRGRCAAPGLAGARPAPPVGPADCHAGHRRIFKKIRPGHTESAVRRGRGAAGRGGSRSGGGREAAAAAPPAASGQAAPGRSRRLAPGVEHERAPPPLPRGR